MSISYGLRLPTICALCDHFHQEKAAVCGLCRQHLRHLPEGCDVCRLPLPESHHGLCGYCIKSKPYFDRVYAAYSFDEPLRTLLHEFKYKKALYLRGFLAKLMLEGLPLSYQPDCLIPVPMHPKRLRERGFNPAAELTKALVKQWPCTFNLNLCKKILNTTAQVKLNSQKRRANLKNAFVAAASPYAHVTIIDDLLTTGSTANELAKTLKQQGVVQVDVWCVARTAH